MENEGENNGIQETEGMEVNADTVNISLGCARNVTAATVIVRQGGIEKATADSIVVRQGAVLSGKSTKLEMIQGEAALVQAEQANLSASNAMAVLSNGDVKMDQSIARVVAARGNVTLDQGASFVTAGQSVTLKNSGTVFLIAQNVSGDVKALFGPRESLLFGGVAGAVAGAILLLANLAQRRRRHH